MNILDLLLKQPGGIAIVPGNIIPLSTMAMGIDLYYEILTIGYHHLDPDEETFLVFALKEDAHPSDFGETPNTLRNFFETYGHQLLRDGEGDFCLHVEHMMIAEAIQERFDRKDWPTLKLVLVPPIVLPWTPVSLN